MESDEYGVGHQEEQEEEKASDIDFSILSSLWTDVPAGSDYLEQIAQQKFSVSEAPIEEKHTVSSGKSRRRYKDPSAPKNPMSAYLFFVAEERTKLSGTADSQRFSEVARSLGEKWRSMSAADRAPYVELARRDKERYLKEKSQFVGLGQRIYLSP
jgi:hypothetical protein